MRHLFIKHERSMDVCFEVYNIGEYDAYLYEWNMGQTEAFPIGTSIQVPIRKLHEQGWQMCVNSEDILKNSKSFREGKWVPLMFSK